MSKAKHLSMLIFKLLFILLCFAAASFFTVLQSVSLDALDTIKGKRGLDGCSVLVLDNDFPVTGASLSYEFVDGDIVFDISQSGARYDDIMVLIVFPEYTYDATEMREFLRDTVGDRAEREEAYLTAMETGPWNCNISFSLTGRTAGVASKNLIYTLEDPDLDQYTAVLASAGSEAEREITEDFSVEKGDKPSFFLTFGAETLGALPSGKYTFSADLNASGLRDGNASISFGTTVNVLTNLTTKTMQEQGISIFAVENWLTFYGLMVALGMFIYLWRDVRLCIKIFGAMMETGGVPVKVIVTTYINGCYSGQYTYYEGGPSLWLSILVSVLCFMVFVLTVPLRILIHIIRDIVYLFVEDYELDGFSYLGNILGSVGIYTLVFGFVGLIGAGIVYGIIGTVLGIGMCVLAGWLCKRKEEEYG